MRRKRHVKSPSWAEQTLERNSEKKGGEKKTQNKKKKRSQDLHERGEATTFRNLPSQSYSVLFISSLY